jgi:uracil-DNA glycosylase
MLRALQLPGGQVPVRLMRSHRGVASGASGSPGPIGEMLTAALAGPAPRVVLAMGPLAAQSLLQGSEPLGKLRGRALALAMQPALPLVVTYHPAYLLRNPADKARTWFDLCLAADQVDRSD